MLALVALVAGGCGGASTSKTFAIAGIPDVDVSLMEARFNGMAQYLSKETGLKVEYVPAVDYAAVVTGFKNGDLPLAWYGGLTGVQARLAVPGANAIAQRPVDSQFRSVFVADPSLGIKTLADLKGKTFTFGSESSTSGYLMPLHFLTQAGVDVTKDLKGPANYSGSHDKTWKLVETGAFQAGVLNASVWDTRVKAGDVDTKKVDVVVRTDPYFDYHWVLRPDVDKTFGAGTAEKIKAALLKLNAATDDEQKRVAEAFQTDRFVETVNGNYVAIETVARQIGIIRQ